MSDLSTQGAAPQVHAREWDAEVKGCRGKEHRDKGFDQDERVLRLLGSGGGHPDRLAGRRWLQRHLGVDVLHLSDDRLHGKPGPGEVGF
jgi:hypothetical protein